MNIKLLVVLLLTSQTVTYCTERQKQTKPTPAKSTAPSKTTAPAVIAPLPKTAAQSVSAPSLSQAPAQLSVAQAPVANPSFTAAVVAAVSSTPGPIPMASTGSTPAVSTLGSSIGGQEAENHDDLNTDFSAPSGSVGSTFSESGASLSSGPASSGSPEKATADSSSKKPANPLEKLINRDAQSPRLRANSGGSNTTQLTESALEDTSAPSLPRQPSTITTVFGWVGGGFSKLEGTARVVGQSKSSYYLWLKEKQKLNDLSPAEQVSALANAVEYNTEGITNVEGAQFMTRLQSFEDVLAGEIALPRKLAKPALARLVLIKKKIEAVESLLKAIPEIASDEKKS